MSGFHTIPREYRDEAGRMVKGDSEDEIRRSIAVSLSASVLVAFCLRTINLRTIRESSRILRINSNPIMGYTSQLNLIKI